MRPPVFILRYLCIHWCSSTGVSSLMYHH
jgi:hypothetical protein